MHRCPAERNVTRDTNNGKMESEDLGAEMMKIERAAETWKAKVKSWGSNVRKQGATSKPVDCFIVLHCMGEGSAAPRAPRL